MSKQLDIGSLDLSGLAAEIPNMTEQEQRKALLAIRRLKESKSGAVGGVQHRVPKTDDEYWNWIKEKTGYEIPRVAVCDDHQAPFDWMTDYFFERERSILVMAGRETGKTAGVSICHYANSELKPECESVTFADIEAQSKKAYAHLKTFIYEDDGRGHRKPNPSIDGEPLRSETRWKNGAKVEVLIGSKSGVNSPHPQKAHADEVDLMDKEVWDESRSMASSKTRKDGSVIKAQDIATSTRKSTRGLMQELVNEIEDAERKGFKPPWKLYCSCVFEIAKEEPACRGADPEDRKKRLIELGRDPCELCNCNKQVKGEWSENNPRTLETVCKGKFFKSRGWMSHEDVVGKFTQNAPNVWVAQLECRRPMADGLYLPSWSRDRFVIKGYEPKPEYGWIWQGIDWGGSEASFCIWIQGPLHRSIEATNINNARIVIPKGAYVAFKEISEANVGATRLADKVVREEIHYKNRFPGWRVKARFADMAGKQQRDDWREHNPPLRTNWYIDRAFEPTVLCVQELVTDGLLYCDVSGAPTLCDDFESWRQKNGKEVAGPDTHGPAASRYCLRNVTTVMKRYTRSPQAIATPSVAYTREPMQPMPFGGVPAVIGGGLESEAWRNSMGPPTRRW